MQRIGLLLLLLAWFPVSAQQTGTTTNKNQWIPADQDLRILEVRVKQYTFDDVVAAYQFEDIILLPLGAISELLDIAIEISPGVASGFVFKEEYSFYLDTTRQEITLQGVLEKYNGDKVQVLTDDIYVDSALLSRWLSIHFDVDLYAARIWVRSEEPLPFEKRLEREKRIARSLSRLNQKEEQYLRLDDPYQNWSTPFIDQTIRLETRKTRDGDTTNSYQYTTYATADVAKLESALYFSGNDQDNIDEFRLTFGRKDPQGGLLGKLNAREYAFGSLVEPRLALINQPSTLEPGIGASSFPLGRQSEFDRHRFIGTLLPGWEVELYRNNALIGYQAIPVDGQYDFQDVPLLFGSNHFRLQFYGPQGQIRTEDYHFDLDQSLTRAGEQYYRATTTEDAIDGQRTVLEYDAGLNKRLSASANLVSIPLQGRVDRKQHNYLSAGLRSYWNNFFVTLDLINDSASGNATQLNLQSRLGSTIVGFTDILLNQFFSEEFRPTEVELSRRSHLRIDTAIPQGYLPRMPITFEFNRDEFAAGGGSNEFINLISLNARGLSVSNQLIYQKITGLEPTSTGTLQLSTNYSSISLRGNLNYQLDPGSSINSVTVTADPGNWGIYRLTLGLNHSLDLDLTEVSIDANKASGRYNLGLGARYNSDDEFTINATFSVGLGQEPRSQQWIADARNMASNGSISARVFLDTNQDGVFNDGDEPLEDIGFRLNGGYNKIRTDENGIAFITGLPVHQNLNLSVAPDTIVDPLWTLTLDGVRVVPRPGHPLTVDFPIFVSGEIDGTVYVAKDGKQFGVGRVIVELLDDAGSVVQTTSTAYDGFYIISKIPLGNYRIRVSRQQQAKLGLVADKTETFAIEADELFVNGLDFVLREITP